MSNNGLYHKAPSLHPFSKGFLFGGSIIINISAHFFLTYFHGYSSNSIVNGWGEI
ncbi:MAG: hypothetical protein QOK72_11240 [Nitrososphaeraceae archaeon]|nr:hypothetical protein [Nitrososphaeraceae archaeon]